MRCLLAIGIWLVRRLMRRGSASCEAEDECARARFAMRFDEIARACDALSSVCSDVPRDLAYIYAEHVWQTRHPAQWWQENEEYLASGWFIWAYAQRNALMPPAKMPLREPPLYVIRPENGEGAACASILLERAPARAGTGYLRVVCTQDDKKIVECLRLLGFAHRETGFVRRLDEQSAPLEDRAAEAAVFLLEEGFSVCVQERALQRRILAHEYEPEHRYWVLAPAQEDRLQLVYPRDQQLHQYVCMAGGRWNGQYMEIAIQHASRLEELMRLYGFRATEEAQRRLEAWKAAVLQATVYRQRRVRHQPPLRPEDQFKALLARKGEVIEDLVDTDE